MNPFGPDKTPHRVGDYIRYHEEILVAENLISLKMYDDALAVYNRVFSEYEFVFLKDYKIAAQIALFSGDERKACEYLRKSIHLRPAPGK
jgi:hypothetical protein